MADEFLRSKLYEYGANSNLVLEAERDGKRRDEGKGEVESLNGKITFMKMGDKLHSSSGVDSFTETKKRKNMDEMLTLDSKLSVRSGSLKLGASVLSQNDDFDSLVYVPRSNETKLIYEEILRSVQSLIGYQPHDVLRGATDEILGILKDDSIKDGLKQNKLEKIVSKIKPDIYFKLLTLSKSITDFVNDQTDVHDDGKLDEDMAVVFDDDDDLDGLTNVDQNSDDGGETDTNDGRHVIGGVFHNDDINDDETKFLVNPQDIDAHWLQRKLSEFYFDANVSSQLAEETLTILKLKDERVCENQLVLLLDFEKFNLIKLLMKNRLRIYYCIKLKQSETEVERLTIENEMSTDTSGEGLRLLELLKSKPTAENWTKDRIGEFSNKARREVRALNKSVGVNEYSFSDSALENDILLSKVADSPSLVLDSLAFTDGNHLMTNKKCELPEKSWRAQKKGYEEVHVPALRSVVAPGEKLVEVADLPDWIQPAFAGMRSLNRVQSKMLDASLHGSDNMLLCAPTGAGKTNVALLCILNLMGNYRQPDGTFDLSSFKIVYIAPMKALVQECVLSFSKRLSVFGIQVKELSGDQNLTRQQIQDTQIIVTTPEKWDIITRKSGERTYTQLVKLMIIDEIHLLHDERGPVLESLVARVIRQIESTQDMVRLVGLSATLPNYEDVATFLRVEKKGVFFFDNSYRPVPLQQQYIGITEKKALKRFQLMNEICYEKVLQQAGKNQVLIFTHSRAETAKTANALRDLASSNDTLSRFVKEESASLEILKVESETAQNADLRELLPFGFAIHHAGMVRSDRTLVEDLFADKHVQVLVSTATLAWGVNLPCHTVIIKGTQMYSPEQGRWVELSPLDVMQMLGRAGRYGLDSEGEGIIITAHSELQYYLSLMNQQLPIESQFIKKLPDMLNAEIVQGSITNLNEAAAWLAYTYLYVRMLRNPSMYGVPVEEFEEDSSLLQRRLQLIHSAASILDKNGLIKYDTRSGFLQSSPLGRVASHYYVSHTTIRVFNENMKPSMSEIEIFRLFSLSGEFHQIRVRDDEKLELSKLILRVPIPVKESIDEPSAKVNILLQAFISRLTLEGFALVADMTYIQQSACRLMRAIFEIALKKGWAGLTLKVLNVCKMIETGSWGSQSPLRQFKSIPDIIIRKLEKNSDITWDRYFDLKANDLGEMVKIPKMGKTLFKFVHMFPKLLLNAHILPITRSLIKVDLSVTIDFEFDSQVHDSSLLFWVIVEDGDGENILHHEALVLKLGPNSNKSTSLNFTVQLYDPMPPQYFVKVVSDRWLHAETVLPISFRHLILPQRFVLATELLDLQPLPVDSVPNSTAKQLFSSFKFFNPIQTQTFNALYETDCNVLVCAPSGSGKTVCAELALMRLLTTTSDGKCVYIASKKEIVDSIFASWSVKFSQVFNVEVVMLSGDAASDLKLLTVGRIIVTTATNWDVISRRWKQRKAVQNVSLFVFDELHLVGGGTDGVAFEVVVSRSRYVASQLDKSVRVIGLSTSLANSSDVGDWLGVTSQNIFNFSPDVRPVPMELTIQSFEMNHFSSRILAMGKTVYETIAKQTRSHSTILFVPSRKQAQLSAIDILTFAATSGNAMRFCGDSSDSRLEEVLQSIKDPAVAHAVGHGVGYLHTSMNDLDLSIIEFLFRDGLIQVLIVPHNMCWKVKSFASQVIIMDTVFYEGREHRFIDYGICDILQMIGRAGRQTLDQSAKCFVLCHSPKREYLKKLLHESLPIESHLNHYLHDHLNAEIVTKTIETKPDAVDYLTWTFYYRRIVQNPNYYNLVGVSHRHLSDHLSDLIENTISDLEESKCVMVENDVDLLPMNLGMIASYYYIDYSTVELFASSLTAKTRVKGVIDILSSSSEFSRLTIRQGEEKQLHKAGMHVLHPVVRDAANMGAEQDSKIKASVLLQCHFSRFVLTGDIVFDQAVVLKESVKLLQALVDVISSQGMLLPALSAIEVSQMVVQGLWNKDSVLLQIPHFSSDLIVKLKQQSPPVETVFDVMDLSDISRDSLLCFTQSQMSDVARFCNSYPNVSVAYELLNSNTVNSKDSVTINVDLTREFAEEGTPQDLLELGTVVCPRFPSLGKKECWWLIVGDSTTNSLLSIKRVTLTQKSNVKLEFTAPDLPGTHSLVMYLMCDSYMGCDQEYEFDINVNAI